MNRNEEYRALLAELEHTPQALEYTLQRARARRRKHRLGRLLGIPAGSLAVCFLTFALLVNLLPTFAYACGSVPVVRELAKAVAWSPSLSAAVDNEYVQPMDLEQTVNDITARIEYVIVDQKQLHIFYSLHSQKYDHLEAGLPELGEEQKCSIVGSHPNSENGELLEFTLNYAEQDVPDVLTMTFGVYPWQAASGAEGEDAPVFDSRSLEEQLLEEDHTWEYPDFLAEFAFTLELDPWYTAQGELISVQQAFQADGQTLVLTDAEVYPTHMRLNLSDDSANTAWATGFDYYVENEKGQRFDGISNGISATGVEDSPRVGSLYMESPFFMQSRRLTLHITRIYWLDKAQPSFRVDLNAGSADWLPDGVALEKVTKGESGFVLAFTARQYRDGHTYDFIRGCQASDGRQYSPNTSWSSDQGNGRFKLYIALSNYPDAVVDVLPTFGRVTEFETPLTVTIK